MERYQYLNRKHKDEESGEQIWHYLNGLAISISQPKPQV